MELKLKELREKRGLSQAAVADFIGISRQMYNKYENGEVEPSLKAVKSLCELYNITYQELLGETQIDLSEKKQFSYHKIDDGSKEIASPTPAYGVNYGTTNVLAQIMELLPKLLYSEKAKLLTTVAQSMSNDVEAGRLAQRKRKEPRVPTYEEWKHGMEEIRKITEDMGFNTHGIKWKCFIDSNLLVYTFDPNELDKMNFISDFLDKIKKTENSVISTQSLGEFYNVATKKLKLSKEKAENACRKFAETFPVYEITTENVFHAMEISRKTQYSYWDSLILAVASDIGCSTVYSEDLTSGQTVDGVKVVNPFYV